MNYRLLATTACWIAAATSTQCAELAEQIDRLALPYVESETVVGMTVGVVKGDQMVVRGFGRLSADNSQAPDGQTIYEIGSVSKVFTGLLLADAMAAGRVSMVTPVDELLPKGVKLLRREKTLPARLWHLSTHTSGLPRLPDNLEPADPNNPYADYDGRRLAAFLKKYQPRKRPGEEMSYSNLGAGLLGDLLAAERKTDYDGLLRERIAKPLALKDTTTTIDAARRDRLAPPHGEGGVKGYSWDFDKLAGAGEIRSTVDDLLTFARAQLDPPEGKLGQAIDLAWQVHQKPIEKSDFAMGLGWHVARDGSTRWHNGQTGGYHSAMFVSRRFDAAVVVLTNTATGEVDRLAEDLMRALAGADVKPRVFEKAAEIDADVMERYVGNYQFAPGLILTVSADNGKLMAALTGQQALRVYPESETVWKYKAVQAELTFKVNRSGKCTAVVLFQNGLRQTAKRIR